VSAVAQGFGEALVKCRIMRSLLSKVGAIPHGPNAEEAVARLEMLPASARLVWDDEHQFPLVQVRNVFMVPGVHDVVKQSARRLCDLIFARHRHVVKLKVLCGEAQAASAVSKAPTFPECRAWTQPLDKDDQCSDVGVPILLCTNRTTFTNHVYYLSNEQIEISYTHLEVYVSM